MPPVDPADLGALDAATAAARIREGRLSPVALVDALLTRVRAVDPRVAAWAHVD